MPLGITQKTDGAYQPPRWHLIYYVLASFDLLTIIATFVLNFATLTLYTNSVDENNRWATRAGMVSDLSLALIRVNGPGNDIFQSHDADQEQHRLAQHHAQFVALHLKITQELQAITALPLQQSLAEHLQRVHAFENALLEEANHIFTFYRQQDMVNAGKHMAIMDQHFASASHALSELNQKIRSQQTNLLNADIKKAQALSRYEYVIIGTILMMVMGIVFYGRLLSRKMKASDAQIRHLLAHNKGIVDTCQEGILTITEQGVIESINPAGARLFEYNEQELIGKNVMMLLGFQEPSMLQNVLLHEPTNANGSPASNTNISLTGQKKSGVPFPITVSTGKMLLSDARAPALYVITVHDVTLPQQLQNHLTEAKNKAEAANAAKSYFLANMSHEIRTPMAGVIGMLDLIAYGELSSKQQQYMGLAQTSAKGLLVIINDILDFSKIEAGKLSIDTIDFHLRDLS
jgi:PAS domain S-box-containing protein